MSTTTPMQYTQLDPATLLNLIRQRIRDLETQYAQLSLRINAPSPSDVITQADRDNITVLTNGLNYLHAQESSVQTGENPAPASASAPSGGSGSPPAAPNRA